MAAGRLTRLLLRLATLLTLVFIYVPIAIVFIYAFNDSVSTAWPPKAYSLRWIFVAIENTALQRAFLTSIVVALGATAIALVLGTLASLAVSRYRFFGREAVSFMVIFPIALPGIITGIALAVTFARLDFPLGVLSIIVGHGTFCIVIVYNNALARLRRMAGSFEEASADLGAHTWQTFRYVTFPAMRSALLAGALLAFALSYDEVIVTIFTNGGVKTLPIWIFESFRVANQVPLVNVAGVVAIMLSVIPVYLATRITGDASGVTGARG
jgi:putative spermidine/putrescine transport system permease protein